MGVGMSLEPSPDPGSNYCHVSSMKDGGALANDGRVKPGDKLMRVDGFDCMGVPRASPSPSPSPPRAFPPAPGPAPGPHFLHSVHATG